MYISKINGTHKRYSLDEKLCSNNKNEFNVSTFDDSYPSHGSAVVVDCVEASI